MSKKEMLNCNTSQRGYFDQILEEKSFLLLEVNAVWTNQTSV